MLLFFRLVGVGFWSFALWLGAQALRMDVSAPADAGALSGGVANLQLLHVQMCAVVVACSAAIVGTLLVVCGEICHTLAKISHPADN
jgi:hypothetical protein